MRYIPQGEEITVGDAVLTRAWAATPKRLVIGQVASVKRTDVQMFKRRAFAAVRLRDLEMVQVLLQLFTGRRGAGARRAMGRRGQPAAGRRAGPCHSPPGESGQ